MRNLIPAALVLVLVSLTASLNAQKGKPPTTVPATASFRCPGESCPVADASQTPPVLTDAITGDQYGAYTAVDGALIDKAGEFALYLKNGRSLWLDFSHVVAACAVAGCRRTFTDLSIDEGLVAAFHTNVIDPATNGEAALGLRSIPLGGTWRARLKVAFNTVNASGQTIQWAVRFNPRDYPPSDHISVTRTATRQWVLWATSAEQAMLVSVCCKQRSETNEGLYNMPFTVVVNEQ